MGEGRDKYILGTGRVKWKELRGLGNKVGGEQDCNQRSRHVQDEKKKKKDMCGTKKQFSITDMIK